MPDLLPLFLTVSERRVALVGGGRVAAGKLQQLVAAGAHVAVVAPAIAGEIRALAARLDPDRPERESPAVVRLFERPFAPSDLDGVWLVVAAATPEVNREVAAAAEERRLFVNAVDDPANATAYLSGVVRRDGVTVAISTSGDAPALTSLLREAIDALLPRDLAAWVWQARAERVAWRREGVPMEQRKPRLLRALNALYPAPPGEADRADGPLPPAIATIPSPDRGPDIPWLHAPEDSWL
jgi:uroporphyrin-III C-methyltransferase / precorrin-2 dehydrogenase / sirohydrochlorin ferrochelatase